MPSSGGTAGSVTATSVFVVVHRLKTDRSQPMPEVEATLCAELCCAVLAVCCHVSVAWRTLSIQGTQHLMVPLLVTGCKVRGAVHYECCAC